MTRDTEKKVVLSPRDVLSYYSGSLLHKMDKTLSTSSQKTGKTVVSPTPPSPDHQQVNNHGGDSGHSEHNFQLVTKKRKRRSTGETIDYRLRPEATEQYPNLAKDEFRRLWRYMYTESASSREYAHA